MLTLYSFGPGANSLKPLPGKNYALKDAAAALNDMMNRSVLGKSIVLPRA